MFRSNYLVVERTKDGEIVHGIYSDIHSARKAMDYKISLREKWDILSKSKWKFWTTPKWRFSIRKRGDFE